jgi:hypothetical protein
MSIATGWTLGNRIALGALAASVALAALVGIEARRVDPLPSAPAARRAAAMPVVKPRAAARTDAVVMAAVARDPFRADRRRPVGRYRLPGDPILAAAPAPPAAPPPQLINIRLVGTVVLPDGGLAALAGQTGESRVVRVGQEFEGFRLTRVAHGTATLRGNDTTVVLKQGGSP